MCIADFHAAGAIHCFPFFRVFGVWFFVCYSAFQLRFRRRSRRYAKDVNSSAREDFYFCNVPAVFASYRSGFGARLFTTSCSTSTLSPLAVLNRRDCSFFSTDAPLAQEPAAD